MKNNYNFNLWLTQKERREKYWEAYWNEKAKKQIIKIKSNKK